MASAAAAWLGWATLACLAAWLLSLAVLEAVCRLAVAYDPASRDPLALSDSGRLSGGSTDSSESAPAAAGNDTAAQTGKACQRIGVGLVIAHPDDESMFFAPTLRALASNPEYDVSVLCLSTGNAYGLGVTRSRELLEACAFLGVSKDRVSVVDHPQIQDGFNTGGWEAGAITPVLQSFVSSQAVSVLVSFDEHGVSGHPNHRSSCLAIRRFKDSLTAAEDGHLSLWELKSVHLSVKLLGPVAALFMWAQHQLRLHLYYSPSQPHSQEPARQGSRSPAQWSERLLLLPSFRTCLSAMRLHSSQWVWFRWLFVLLSTYPYANQLVLYDMPGSKLKTS